MSSLYYAPPGGLRDQNSRTVDRAVFTEAYAFLPAHTLSDITTSYLPGWDKARAWVLARPMSGFAETFAQISVEIAPGGGASKPEPDAQAEGVIFVLKGALELTLKGETHKMSDGGYAFLAPGEDWSLANTSDAPVSLMWIRKIWEPAEGIAKPESFVTSDQVTAARPMEGTEGKWATTRFVEPDDMRHDMHVNIVTIQPGATIPFAETHVMEHGLYVLQGRGVYLLNKDWVEVEGGDFMWLRAFCPQACYAGGTGPFRYLLYKDVNRHMPLRGMLGR
ncbi:bifunctional allantoicase/(S)-ureidoglycine aminohydrolase [Thioclava sp. GXIMD2076]|uniref:bifunctional allantoicase/(S)-ureidoglycine aminohydrolase n=1 Tax=Thioclava sp. GXIMD2076 TaxID=3131931 RepID=UPI0030D5EA71